MRYSEVTHQDVFVEQVPRNTLAELCLLLTGDLALSKFPNKSHLNKIGLNLVISLEYYRKYKPEYSTV